MPSHVRRQLRRARRGLGYTVAIALVVVALVLGVASQVLPLVEQHPERVAAWLSERAGRTIAFDGVQTRWTRRGPLLQLDNLRVGEGDKAFTVGDTEMLVSIYAGLLPDTPLSELRLRGLDLTLERVADGRWQVRGLPGQQQSGVDPFEALEGLGELQVIDGKLAVIAPRLGIEARIPRIDLRLQVSGERVRAGVRAWPAADIDGVEPRPLDAALELDRDSGDGRVYAGARRADLAPWSPLLQLLGVTLERGAGRAQAWATLEGRRVADVTVDAALDAVALRGTPVNPAAAAPRTEFARVEARARWRRVEGGWRLDAPTLAFTDGDRRRPLDGLLLAGGERMALVARQIDVGPLAAIAALSDRVSPATRRWLRNARPRATLHDVELAGAHGAVTHAAARIESLGFDPVGSAPGVSGLAATLEGDAAGFRLQPDPSQRVAFDWPGGFGVVHTVKLDGTINGWREGAGWRVGTAALAVDGEGFGADARGSLWWQGDGSRPWIDIAARIDEVALPVAKGFWVHHLMPAGLVEWLDTALVAGTVQDGRALLVGDLDDWPFVHDDGRFEATAHIADATLRFQPDWPAARQVELDASFIGNGFTLQGRGALGDIQIGRLSGAIDHYGQGALTVRAQGTGDVSDLLGVLRQSPLRRLNPETFDSIKGGGPAAVDFNLRLPLHRGRMAIRGEVALDEARLSDPRWDIAFDRVRGRAVYDHHGFHADALRVRHDGRPGLLALRAGDGHVRDRGNAFEAGLDADFDADALLERAPDLAWLAPHLQGRSRWEVGVAVPGAGGGRNSPAQLRLRSDLVGTALALPAPLQKSAAEPLAATVEVPLPLGSGDVRVGLGDVLALRSRSDNGRTGVRIALGSRRVDQPPPASGLVATGRANSLDAVAWIGLVQGGRSGADGEGLPLQRIDVTAAQLQLLGGVFPETRLQVSPAAAGATAVRVEGEALQGALVVPAATGATISGRFERVQWRAAKDPTASTSVATASTGETAGPAAAATPPPAPGPASDFDPHSIPPLSFDIDDLRVRDAHLGRATVRTRPIASGLELEQLQTRAPGHSIDVSGRWTGRGDSARTRLTATLDSEDFGALLGGLGYGERLAGGEGVARFEAGWPRGPADFSLATVEGGLTLEARDGRLLEVEPGAGRVFGLLSIAELPRRLSLDFRDFFSKGFAFNEIDGAIRFADGVARSDALQIDGPSAQINIHGTANLRNETFDQTIEVLPKAGNLLTAVGAIAGGPVGAALGAAANAVLSKPLGQITSQTYKVTGPWADPDVEVISREQGRLSTREAAPAG